MWSSSGPIPKENYYPKPKNFKIFLKKNYDFLKNLLKMTFNY